MEEQELILQEPVEQPAWGDLYLKFASEEEANQVLEGYPGSIDVIGVIWKPVGEFDEEGGQAAEAIPGWHVNVRGQLLPELVSFSVEVATPARVWA